MSQQRDKAAETTDADSDWSNTVYVVAVVDRKEGLIVSVYTDAHEAWESLRLNYAADLAEDDPDYPEALADELEAQGLAWAITEQRITT
ncbi:MAG: hypothetical protein HZY75_05300 [Nocardioidaceae bacterium]|nr:MAG: hypothetical protein HZY75_05300 [Nocardioidaceae bacterium]